jgi:hypothetical protein
MMSLDDASASATDVRRDSDLVCCQVDARGARREGDFCYVRGVRPGTGNQVLSLSVHGGLSGDAREVESRAVELHAEHRDGHLRPEPRQRLELL